MNIRNVILIALAVIFNDFVGSVIGAIGLLLLKFGDMVASIPTLF